jgi:hypothetical protein
MQLSLAVRGDKPHAAPTELLCEAASAVLGISTTIGPTLLFLGKFGARSIGRVEQSESTQTTGNEP